MQKYADKIDNLDRAIEIYQKEARKYRIATENVVEKISDEAVNTYIAELKKKGSDAIDIFAGNLKKEI